MISNGLRLAEKISRNWLKRKRVIKIIKKIRKKINSQLRRMIKIKKIMRRRISLRKRTKIVSHLLRVLQVIKNKKHKTL